MVPLFNLPADVLWVMLQHLPNEDKLSLRRTCQTARSKLDALWQPLKGTYIPV
jgi:hypothetical protein